METYFRCITNYNTAILLFYTKCICNVTIIYLCFTVIEKKNLTLKFELGKWGKLDIGSLNGLKV